MSRSISEAARTDRASWLPDVKSVFASASRRFAENKNMSHALVLLDIGGLSVPAQEDVPEGTDVSLYASEAHDAVARLISAGCGKRDIFGEVSADRFAIITSGFANRVELEKFISRIIYRIKVASLENGSHLTVEVGAAILDSARMSAAELFKAAELALFNVKNNSDDSYEIFDRRLDAAKVERPRESVGVSRMQKVLDYAFDAFSSEETTGFAAKDVLANMGRLYGLNRIFITSVASTGGILTQWNDSEAPAATEDDCLELMSDRNVKQYNSNGFIITDSRIAVGLFQGFALVGAACFERTVRSEPLGSDKTLVSEIITFAKLISVYAVKLLISTAKRDEVIYCREALEENKTACYAVDCDSYRIIFANSYAEKMIPSVRLGKLCPQLITGLLDKIKSGEEKSCDSRGVYHFDTYEKHMQKWLSTAITCTRRSSGDYAFLVMTMDMSELMDSAKTKDKLTGLLTYEGFEMEAEKMICGDDEKYMLALFKVYNFRNINDEFGYEVGDEILKITSEKIKLILGEGERAARYSGSGFLGLFRSNNLKVLTAKLEYLFKVVQDDISKKHPMVSFAFTCGIYPIEKGNYKLSTAIDRANLVIKSSSKNKYIVSNTISIYDFELNRELEERRQIECDMVSALKNNEFEIVYQPKVMLDTGRIYGAEALIRWRRPSGKVIHPSTFVPIFEDNEFVLEMDIWVYRRVFSQMRSWMEQGIELPVVSVNVSRLHLRDSGFPEYFEKIVDSYGIPHKNVEVELTESAFVKGSERLITLLNDIRSRGFSISIDDFGTGYSTLNLISILPADVLKLDGNFFMNNPLTDKNRKVIESIIMLAKKLGLKVISEGVETDEQVKFLRQNRCDAVQGFYFYRPVSEHHFKEILQNRQSDSSPTNRNGISE